VAPEQVRSSSDFAPTADVHALSATSFHVIGGAASEYDALPGSPARRTEGTDLTRTGQVLGTPAYMAPEQASGQTADARTDVYALGAILYHVVTGSPPYSGHSSVGIIEKILSSAPAPVQSLQDGVPIDLVSVIQKALHRDPKRRYSNALALAEELRRVQAGQLVRARDYSAMELAVRWFTRHRGYVVGGAIAFVLLLAIAAISFNRVVHARDIALREKLRADERSAAFQVARS
jgi:serine/threonine protein kinase